MTNADLSTLLVECADELQAYRQVLPLSDMGYENNAGYEKLKALELKARKAAQEVIKSRDLNPIRG